MKYRAKRGEFRFKDDTILDLLRKTKPEAELVTLFQSVRRVADMKIIADNLQVHMVLSSASSHRLVNDAWLKAGEKLADSPLQKWMDLKVTPEELASLSGVPNPINFSKLPRNDPTYGNVEAYTMRFADRHSGKLCSRN
ncbi:hypothetical protein GQ600_26923 [Phytophthora cactorum]|nr:hypothetical protein GQ600_26923 [Phytophthora cactorum]